MAKITPQRKPKLDSPEGIREWADLWLEQVKPYTKWLITAVAVMVIGMGAWWINGWIKSSREEKAAAALAEVTPKIELNIPATVAANDLEKFINQYPGTRAAWEAQLTRANLLYKLERYDEAAKAYESLLDKGDPGFNILINESLSYCYEGMGNYKKAAEVLKPVEEQTRGAMQSEVRRRLAMLSEQAKEPGQAAVYWRKLLENPPDSAMAAYLQEKLAAVEAGAKK